MRLALAMHRHGGCIGPVRQGEPGYADCGQHLMNIYRVTEQTRLLCPYQATSAVRHSLGRDTTRSTSGQRDKWRTSTLLAPTMVRIVMQTRWDMNSLPRFNSATHLDLRCAVASTPSRRYPESLPFDSHHRGPTPTPPECITPTINALVIGKIHCLYLFTSRCSSSCAPRT